MELNLIPICNLYNHKMEDSDYLLDKDIYCDICNNNISYYRCINCEYVTCIDCQRDIIKENNEILENMKITLCNEFNKISKEVGDKYEVIFYKETGNIYLHDPINKSTRRYEYENKNN